jgi:heat-inducible transcriptional repressor
MTDAASGPAVPTERQTRILALVVREHVETAQPVSSSWLVQRYHLGVSPATVRGELAALEEMGLLTHPHTSAGRVPTVAGYRFFVEKVMTAAHLTPVERRAIRARFLDAAWDPERWLQLSAAVIAQTSGAAGLVATPRARSALLRRLEMIDLGDGVVQVVAVLANGEVRQVRWCPRQVFDQSALDGMSSAINDTMCGRSTSAWCNPAGASPLALEGLAAVRELMRHALEPATMRLYHAGLTQILGEPEFAAGDQLRTVVAILEHGQGLETILEYVPGSGVQVIIGGEPPLERMPHITMVLSRFGHQDSGDGVLGVVGPTRLPYERAVSAVAFVADLMTQLLGGQAVPVD